MPLIIATWGGDMTSARREAEKAFKKTEVNMESDISLEDMAKEIKELEVQLEELENQWHFSSLEYIFITNKIYFYFFLFFT